MKGKYIQISLDPYEQFYYNRYNAVML